MYCCIVVLLELVMMLFDNGMWMEAMSIFKLNTRIGSLLFNNATYLRFFLSLSLPTSLLLSSSWFSSWLLPWLSSPLPLSSRLSLMSPLP